MILRKANTYRLYPTSEQAQQMAQIAGSCRFVFNLALEQRRDWYRLGRKFSFASQCREVTALRAEIDWLKVAPVHTLQQALKDLDRAYQHWWAERWLGFSLQRFSSDKWTACQLMRTSRALPWWRAGRA
jgi:putative transposase